MARGIRARLGAFEERFWNEAGGYLSDVVDADHVPGTRRCVIRPNQIFAVGGLPFALLDGERARRVVDAVERTAPDAARPAHAGAGRTGIAAYKGECGARRRLPPGHGMALAARAVRRGVGPGPRGTDGPRARLASDSSRPARASLRSRSRPRLRDRRRRAAVHAARLSVPGVVARPRRLRLDRGVLAVSEPSEPA